MSGQAAKVVITERQQVVLLKLSRATTVEFRFRQRARLILLAFEKKLNTEISGEVELNPDQVGLWRRRWRDEFERLTIIEGMEPPCELERAIVKLLSDEQRSGTKPKFTAEQLTMIFAIACEAVEESGRPVARWTQQEIIDEAVSRGIIESMSTSHISTLLKEAQLQPHKSRYWLNTRETDPDVFEQQACTICDCYADAAELAETENTQTVCVDEMTSVQALERAAPKKECDQARKNASSSNTHDTVRCV
jgi:transposase